MPEDSGPWTQTAVMAVDAAGNEVRGSVKWRADGSAYELVIDADEVTTHHRGSDLFDCLSQARRELDQLGLILCCNGARIDAYPSGMARQMGAGLKVYITRLGARGGELVDTFGSAPRDAVGTVTEQEAFHATWRRSIT